MNPLLGISIPTYKRPDQLLETVRSVIVAGRAHAVPVFISDDAADETNRDALSTLRAEYPHLVVSRNATNLGIDANIARSVEINTCQYAWLLGEDDRLTPDAVARVIRVLEQPSPPPFVYVNYAAVNATFSKTLKPVSLRLNGDQWMPAERFWREAAWSAGFIGACVVHKPSWARTDPAAYFGTWFAHVGCIMELCRGRDVLLLAEPLVLNRCGTTEIFTWTSALMDVLDGWRRLCRRMEPLYGKAACDVSLAAFRSAHGLGTIRFLAYTRAGGALTPAVVREQILPGQESWLFKISARILARLPVAWFQALQRWKYR